MIEDSKVVFITHPYYAVNNPTNNLRIYKKAKNSNKWRYIQCKTKEEYRTKLNEYITGFYEYSRNNSKRCQCFNNCWDQRFTTVR